MEEGSHVGPGRGSGRAILEKYFKNPDAIPDGSKVFQI